DTYVKAFCLMRNSIRTFRADRITDICSVETGEAFV
ncbi:WYL domain-containing protein, partial [Vibrio parahaemolyticus]